MINWAYIFWNNRIYQWFEGLIVGFLILAIFTLLKWLVRKNASRTAGLPRRNASTLLNALLDHTPWIIILWLGVFGFLRFLNLVSVAVTVIDTITIMVILILAGLWSGEIIEFWLARRQKVNEPGETSYKKGSMAAVVLIAKVVIWTVVILLALENIPGIHITALIASLGIGGIAIGLALQKILGDLFASLTISIDQPFVEGDPITVDQLSGQVEHIGLKSTRVRSATGELLIFSNSDLLNSRIRNYKSMEHRVVVFTLNITYDTPYKKLQKIPKILKGIVETQPKVTFNRAHFKGYDPSALTYEVVYTINTADFNLYMDIQQDVNLEIFRRFHDDGINFAYPTQTILLNK
jgi:small-conductance mechanosensitive channel